MSTGITLDKFVDFLISQEYEKISIPMKFLLQFKSYFVLGEENEISAKTADIRMEDGSMSEIPVIALAGIGDGWTINIGKEGINNEDLKKVIVGLFEAYRDSDLTDKEYSESLSEWKSEISDLNTNEVDLESIVLPLN